MHVTDIKIRRSFTEGNLLAVFTIVLDEELALHDIKLIKGREKFIIAMPSRVGMDGTHRDIVHPIKAELRSEIETRIIQFYENL
ncbi:MAG: SpoVG family protein [Eubacteriales bacterium]|nr:SpoVG family protein [Eubacteriales bacterium]MDD4422444.1 SpoVG family protein [Eubacteriales bacterium]